MPMENILLGRIVLELALKAEGRLSWMGIVSGPASDAMRRL